MNFQKDITDLPNEQVIPLLFRGPKPQSNAEPRTVPTSYGSITFFPDIQGEFCIAIPEALKHLSKTALVCNEWREMQELNCSWKPILDRFIINCKFDIDLSKETTNKGKVQLFVYRLKELKLTMLHSNLSVPPNIWRQSFCSTLRATSLFFTTLFFKNDVTELFKDLIKVKKFELLAKNILFRPNFDPTRVAFQTFRFAARSDSKFCLELIVKKKYDLSGFFGICRRLAPSVSPAIFSLFNYTGITIGDFVESGCNFSLTESDNPGFSMLHAMLPHISKFYETGSFHNYKNMTPPVFFDQELQQQICKNSITEEDVKKFILDLLTKANLNLDIVCPSFGSIEEGTALSQLRQLGDSLLPGNAVSEALVEFDKHY